MVIWVDTGSPNTLVPVDFIKRSGLSAIKGSSYKGVIAGSSFSGRPAVMLPEIVIPDYRSLRNVRAIAALDGDKFAHIIVLGLNVLNHGKLIINREAKAGTLEFYESLVSKVEGSARHRFNHLIFDGQYLITDAEADEPETDDFSQSVHDW